MRTLRNLSRSNPRTQAEILQSLLRSASDAPADEYGIGITPAFEKRVAELFDVEACLVMPSGKAMQNAALKIWAQRRGSNRIALHPRSHIEEIEEKAYSEVFGLRSVAFGPPHAQPCLSDLTKIPQTLGAASVELALRPLGGTLIPWPELARMSAHCRAQGIPFHADAARVWEAQAGYDRPFPEIAALFDSLYVSFYKVLDGLVGGALLGPADFIAEARIWQKRLGQSPYRQFPYVLAAAQGLDEVLPRVPEFCRRARSLSIRLSDLKGIFRITPRPAQTNMFQVHLSATLAQVYTARDKVRERQGINLFDTAAETSLSGVVMFEVIAGSALADMSEDEIIAAFEVFLSDLK